MIVGYRYWNQIRNCGDAITAYILRDVLGCTPMMVGIAEPHVLAVGSILFMAGPKSLVWGSGMLSPDTAPETLPSANIRAVRGRESLAALQATRPDLGDVPLGDPGVLVGALLDRADFAATPTRYRAAIVPHYTYYDRLAAAGVPEDCCLVDMRDATLRPLEQIQAAEVVVSQSLHGLVFAAALGKPYVWTMTAANEAKSFKYRDWFSTTENPQATPLWIRAPIEEQIAAAEHRPFAGDPAALLAAFPGAEAQRSGDSPVLGFESIRAMAVAVVTADWIDGLAAAAAGGLPMRRRFARTLDRVTRQYLEGWSEVPYVLVRSTASARLDVDLPALAAFMDRHRGIDAAVLVAGRTLPGGLGEPVIADGGFLAAPGASYRDAAAIVMRPGVPFAFTRAIFTLARS